MKNTRWITVIITCLLVINFVTFQSASGSTPEWTFPPERPEHPLLQYFILAKAALSSMNVFLLTILLVIYLGIYRKTGSQFSLGLIIFSIALLLYSLASNPIIHSFAGFKGRGLGPFTMIPNLFTLIASGILLYLSRQ